MSETMSTVTGNESYAMPQATAGLPIVWYPMGMYDRTNRMVAYMVHCGNRTAVIQTSTGQRRDAVRHLSDPKLKLSDDQRENGAWDFTEEYVRGREMEKTLLERLQRLDERHNVLIAKIIQMEDQMASKPRTTNESPRAQGRPRKTDQTEKAGISERGKKGTERFRLYREKLQRAIDLNLPIAPRPKMAELDAALEVANSVSEDIAESQSMETSQEWSPAVSHQE